MGGKVGEFRGILKRRLGSEVGIHEINANLLIKVPLARRQSDQLMGGGDARQAEIVVGIIGRVGRAKEPAQRAFTDVLQGTGKQIDDDRAASLGGEAGCTAETKIPRKHRAPKQGAIDRTWRSASSNCV